jgi:hypothetical protein
VRHLFAAYELGEDKLYGHIKPRKNRARFLEFCRYLRSLYPPDVRIAIVCAERSRRTRRTRRSQAVVPLTVSFRGDRIVRRGEDGPAAVAGAVNWGA